MRGLFHAKSILRGPKSYYFNPYLVNIGPNSYLTWYILSLFEISPNLIWLPEKFRPFLKKSSAVIEFWPLPVSHIRNIQVPRPSVVSFWTIKSKVGDRSRGRPEGSLLRGVGVGDTPFPGLLHFTLDTYLNLLSVKKGDINYHFLSLLVRHGIGLNPGLPDH